jgi:hypothetical protein
MDRVRRLIGRWIVAWLTQVTTPKMRPEDMTPHMRRDLGLAPEGFILPENIRYRNLT